MKSGQIVADREGWKTVSRQTHYQDEHLSVATEEVRTPARKEARAWTVVHRKAAVVIAPLTEAGELILIRQERIPVRAAIWEVPAGQIDEAGDPAEQEIKKIALRELREETGYCLAPTGELISLGYYFASPGFTDEHAYLFVARNVVMSDEGQAHDESESIVDCRNFTPREVARMIANGEIRDANTLAICARMIASGLLSFYA